MSTGVLPVLSAFGSGYWICLSRVVLLFFSFPALLEVVEGFFTLFIIVFVKALIVGVCLFIDKAFTKAVILAFSVFTAFHSKKSIDFIFRNAYNLIIK